MTHLEVIVDDNLPNNPCCQHGPTVLFHRTDQSHATIEKYYACTASRDGKCSFKVAASKKSTCYQDASKPAEQLKLDYDEVRNASVSQKVYCIQCQQLFLESNAKDHNKHKLFDKLSNEILLQPTRFLAPLSMDGNEAQYFFSDSSLNCIENMLKQVKITKVICLGAPRLHEHLLVKTDIKSLLLDIDRRFHWFYDQSQYVSYNMFNHFFFGGEKAENIFNNYLMVNESTERICIFTDPPFGCRTELLAHTISRINQTYNSVNQLSQQILPTFWIFPYFMETYIQKQMPSMEMSDYQVNYTNHRTYHSGEKGLKHGSPVRIFTNVPLELFKLPVKEGYKWCSECQKSVHRTNLHCRVCKKCPSKNGATYRHCSKCNWCVKPNYVHCNACGRCTQVQGHQCSSYRKQLNCRICLTKGHMEKCCPFWRTFKHFKMAKSGCVVCGSKQHIVTNCDERKRVLKERYFLGQCENAINCVK
ncbi:rRNA N6-adenosine-methyltransferase ZCCHC4 isoform X3 [Aedes albopictus]|uniref:CTCHY-type domain-containing protein n=1 Tax=Aedes albopictus TaxID=7160 RepID=A0ABM1YHX3_AEDAL